MRPSVVSRALLLAASLSVAACATATRGCLDRREVQAVAGRGGRVGDADGGVAGGKLADRVAFSSNLNYACGCEAFDSYSEVGASGSLALGLSDRVGAYIEYFGFFPRSAFPDNAHFAIGGLTFGLNDNLQLDARAGQQVARRADGTGYFLGVGISRRW